MANTKNTLLSESLSFYQLISEKDYHIEIPKLQRDYAQGRKTEAAKEIRENFLLQIKEYLNKAPSQSRNTLDFVYGDVDENKKLILLDGQQRLTTLFLLHWYTALKAGSYDEFKSAMVFDDEGNQKSKFTYNTRESSNDFCNALLKNGQVVFERLSDDKKISAVVKDQTWFLINWKNDLTIQSMLVMLDAIQEKFSDSSDYYAKLTDKENPCIVFNFFPMKSQGLTDELYIKMNSRGRELTRFENLKSKILGKLDELNADVAIRDDFSRKIDTDWIDVFWNLRAGNKINHFDTSLLNFFEAMFVNKCAADESVPVEKVKSYIDAFGAIPFYEILTYSDFVSFVTDCDIFLNAISEGKQFKTFFSESFRYNEKKSFTAIIHHNFSDAAYRERILFFAYSYYITTRQNPSYFEHWMRVIENLMQSVYSFDNPTEFCNAIKSVKEMLDSAQKQDIYAYLPTVKEDFTGIDKAQLSEEKIKILLIRNNADWENTILSAEEQKYFKGQLAFALSYAGLSTLFEKSSDEQKTLISSSKTKFDDCIAKAFPLFGNNGLSEPAKKDARLQRALLSISNGEYMMSIGSNWSFLIDNHRDISWKNYLKGDSQQENDRNIRKWFFNLIDDDLYNPNDMSCLEKIAKKYTREAAPWVKCFVNYPELLCGDNPENPVKIGGQNLIRWNAEDDIYILSGKQMNSYHSELFSIAKFLNYKKTKTFDTPIPFTSLSYWCVSNSTEKPCFYFNEWKYKAADFAMDCFYQGEQTYCLRFFDRNNRESTQKKSFPQEVISLLNNKGFSEVDTVSHEYECSVSDSELLHKLQDVLEQAKKIQ